MQLPWQSSHPESRAMRAALSPLSAAGTAYASLAWLHRTSYRWGILRATRLGCRVISVGNLLVGGSGKTPLAAWIAVQLRRRGHRVAIASRGYGRRGRARVLVVSDGRHVYSDAQQAGDEPMLLAAHAPGVPVLVGRDRSLAGLRAISAFATEVLVLDDGFHHHRLERDVDIVAFDGAAGLANRRVLPRGPLREGTRCLSRVDALGVVDGPLRETDAELLRRRAPDALWFAARRVPLALRPLRGGASQPPASLSGAEVGLLAGIGRPDSFRRTVEGLGARVVAERIRPDHHRYRRSDLRGLAREAPLWVTTEKDSIKILPSWAEGSDVRVLPIGVEVEDSARLLDWLEEKIAHSP